MNCSRFAAGLALLALLNFATPLCEAGGAVSSHYDKLVDSLSGGLSRQLHNFDQYKATFGKKYASVLEEAARQRIYIGAQLASSASRVKYLARQLASFSSINDMSDWTRSEFERILSRYDKRLERVEASDLELDSPTSLAQPARYQDESVHISGASPDASARRLPKEVKAHIIGAAQSIGEPLTADQQTPRDLVHHDLRATNCIGPVKDLKSCGACFIFSTLALYEYMYCKDGHLTSDQQLVRFSEQFVIDCGAAIGIQGCTGGKEVYVAYFVRHFGLIAESEYPFFGQVKRCPYKDEDSVAGQLELSPATIKKVHLHNFPQLLRKTPIATAVFISDSFRNYGGGVEDVSCNQVYCHAMLLVGHGRENGIDYWLYKNSWGPQWGENGYYRLAKRSNCTQVDQGIGYVPLAYLTNEKVEYAESERYDSELIRAHVERLHRGPARGLFKRLFG